MSLILDALHRSDQERRNESAVPGIATRHSDSTLGEARSQLLLPGLAALLLLSVLAWMIIGSAGNQEADAGVDDAVEAPTEPMNPAVSSPAQAEPAGQIATPAGTEAAPVERTVDRESPPRAGRSSGGAPSEGKSAPAGLNVEVAALYRQAAQDSSSPIAAAAAAAPAPGSSKTIPVDALVAAARNELAAPPADDNPIPTVQGLPQRTKDEIPSIFFSTHSWSGNPGERYVTLNGKPRREGDTVSPGLRLLEILPESIVLDFRGTRFRLRALNSWVNL